jgi:glutathione S-transferase
MSVKRVGREVPNLQLYHFWSSVCSVRSRMALEEKRVKWESKYVDLFKFDQLKPDYLAINPDGVVPTLVCDGHIVRESVIINEFIEDAFPGQPPLIPSDPFLAAKMREFISKCENTMAPIALMTYFKYILPKLRNRWSDAELRAQAEKRPTKFQRDLHSRGIRGEVSKQELVQAATDIETLLDGLEATLDPGPWVVGDFSLADITIAPYMFRLSALGQDQFWSVARRPRIHAWYQQLRSRPAFQTAVSWPDENGGGYQEVGLSSTFPLKREI